MGVPLVIIHFYVFFFFNHPFGGTPIDGPTLNGYFDCPREAASFPGLVTDVVISIQSPIWRGRIMHSLWIQTLSYKVQDPP